MKTLNYLGLFFAFLLTGCSGLVAQEASRSGSMNVQIKNLRVKENQVFITLSITNTSSTMSFVDRVNFPVNGVLASDLFSIKKIGSEKIPTEYLEYLGKLINRGKKLSKDDFFTLEPKESKVAEVNLSEFYNFSGANGKYLIVYDAENQVLGSPAKYDHLVSNSLSIDFIVEKEYKTSAGRTKLSD